MAFKLNELKFSQLNYGSVCSGVDAASLAWESYLGWNPVFFSEIERFPSDVLNTRFPNVPNHGDFTTIKEGDYDAIQLLVGGTPCQSFSISGLRKGLADDRGNLALEYCRLLQRLRPRWFIWENVPGVLTSNEGSDFKCILKGFEECGYSCAWRVLDGQYVRMDGYPRALPCRRRRVFVVGYFGKDWRPPAAVLLEARNLSQNNPPSRSAFNAITGQVEESIGGSGGHWDSIVNPHPTLCAGNGHGNSNQELNAGGAHLVMSDWYRNNFVYPIDMRKNQRQPHKDTGTGVGENGEVGYTLLAGQCHAVAHIVEPEKPVCVNEKYRSDSIHSVNSVAPTMLAGDGCVREHGGHAIVINDDRIDGVHLDPKWSEHKAYDENSVWPTISTQNIAAVGRGSVLVGEKPVKDKSYIRRLTPLECERLQGFPDNWTRISYKGQPEEKCPDGLRYKAIGNSMAVNVMRWIGRRIALVDYIIEEKVKYDKRKK